MSKLSNIVGRSDYISNPNRQENILAKSTFIDWKPYQEYERTHKKSSKANKREFDRKNQSVRHKIP